MRVTKLRVLWSTFRVPVSTLGEMTMSEVQTHQSMPMSDRIRRATGRHARKISATAKLTRAEHSELEAAASRAGKALGEWSRDILLAAARGEVITPTFTEIVGMRLLLNATLRYAACGEAMTPEQFEEELYDIRSSKHQAAADVMQQYAETEARR